MNLSVKQGYISSTTTTCLSLAFEMVINIGEIHLFRDVTCMSSNLWDMHGFRLLCNDMLRPCSPASRGYVHPQVNAH